VYWYHIISLKEKLKKMNKMNPGYPALAFPFGPSVVVGQIVSGAMQAL
jgi:hypothetical protein